MAAAFVQAWTAIQNNNNSGGTTGSLTTTSGNFLVAGSTKDSASGETWTISDSKTNSWSQAIAPVNNGSDYIKLNYSFNITGGASHTVSIATQNLRFSVLCAAEYSGVLTTDPIDKTATGTGNSTSLNSSATATTSQADELLIGVGNISGGASITFTGSGGFTVRSSNGHNDTGTTGFICDQVVSSTGTYSATVTASGTANTWVCGIATFKAAGGGAADHPTMKRMGGVPFASRIGGAGGTAGVNMWRKAKELILPEPRRVIVPGFEFARGAI